jgi:hypothetical protein
MAPPDLPSAKRQKLEHPINPSSYTSEPVAQCTVTKPFPFLKLPAEIRNVIYELLLTNRRDPNDVVIHGNDLYRRHWLRDDNELEDLDIIKVINDWQGFVNNTPSTLARLTRPVNGIPPLLEVGILRAGRQTYEEGLHILNIKNNFAAILREKGNWNLHLPYGLKYSSIHNLRIELQLEGPFSHDGTHILRTSNFYWLSKMYDLKFLQILVTFGGRGLFNEVGKAQAAQDAALFDRCWRITTTYDSTMRALIASIPKGIEVSWGLTREQKEVGDYGGFAYAKGCVLRKIYNTYEHMRGIDVGSGNPDWNKVEHLPIDGDGQDSDEEK